MGIGRLAARGLIGGLFIGHGTQKLFGWFDGPGIDGLAPGMEAMGMRPGRRNAYAAGLSEAVGGALLVLGAATPLAAAMITGTMITAIRKVHISNGVWVTGGGWEYNGVLIAAVTALAEVGPGKISVDGALGREWTGGKAAVFVLALGAAASTAAIELGKRGPATPVDAPVETPVPDVEVAPISSSDASGDPVTTDE